MGLSIIEDTVGNLCMVYLHTKLLIVTFVGCYFDARATFFVVCAPCSNARMTILEKWPSKSTSSILSSPPLSVEVVKRTLGRHCTVRRQISSERK